MYELITQQPSQPPPLILELPSKLTQIPSPSTITLITRSVPE